MNKLSTTILFLTIFLFSAHVLGNLVLAQADIGPSNNSVSLQNPLGDASTIPELINSIIAGLRDYIAPPIVAIMVLVGAFQMLFAAGDPDKFSTGKKTILYSVIGYVIIIIASGVSLIIKDLLSQ